MRYSFEDKFFINSLSNLSLKEISILLFSKLTKLTLVSNSYFNLISFFDAQILIRSSNVFNCNSFLLEDFIIGFSVCFFS